MELAKVTSKGQITIPIEIRKRLGMNGEIIACNGRYKCTDFIISVFSKKMN